MRTGFTLVEVLVAAALFLAMLVPVVTMLTSANRVGVAANRLLDVTAFGQAALEAFECLDALDIDAWVARSPGDEGVAVDPDGTRHHLFHESLGLHPPLPHQTALLDTIPTGEKVTVDGIERFLRDTHFPYRVSRKVSISSSKVSISNSAGGDYSIELRLQFPRLPTEEKSPYDVALRGRIYRRHVEP